MLHIGLTGAIGSGKSTIAGMLGQCGAQVIDADAVAREVVEPGTDGLQQVQAEFGAQILTDKGELDRKALAQIAFADSAARRRLNDIMHPLVRAETGRRVAALASDAVVIHDVPLIVENDMAAQYHLVVVVGAGEHTRIRRLLRDRGMTRAEVEARIAAQADDEQRRRVADVWIDNDTDVAGDHPSAARRQAERLWRDRAVPYAQNMAAQRPAQRPDGARLVRAAPEPRSWRVQAHALLNRLRRAGGNAVVHAAHVGSTAVPFLAAKDVIDLQLGVADLAAADDLATALAESGFPRRADTFAVGGNAAPCAGFATAWAERSHANADPCRAVNVHIRVAGSPGWRSALLRRDWLGSEMGPRREYERLKSDLTAHGASADAYAAAKQEWFERAAPRMSAWAQHTGWRPPGTNTAPGQQ